MKRRQVLLGTTAALSGCSGFQSHKTAQNRKATKLRMKRFPQIPTEGMELSHVIQKAETNGNNPLSLVLSLKNTSGSVRNIRLFNNYLLPYRTTRPEALYLADERMNLEQRTDGSWVPTQESNVTRTETKAALNHEMKPGETIQEMIEIWIDPRTEYTHLPTGTFETMENPIHFKSNHIENINWSMKLEITR